MAAAAGAADCPAVPVAYVVLRDHKGEDSHMEECFKCGDGGDILLCDSCNATAHLECAGLSAVPTDEWRCGMCILLRDEAEEKSKECAALDHEARQLHADFPSRRDRQQQKRKEAPTGARQGRERRRRSRPPSPAVSLEGFVKTRVRLPAPWNSAATLRRLVKGGRAFEVAWDDGTPLCIHDVCEVASWMIQRGNTAWAAVQLPERSCMRTWKWLYALRVRSAGLTWGRCGDADALVDAMDAAHGWGSPRRRSRATPRRNTASAAATTRARAWTSASSTRPDGSPKRRHRATIKACRGLTGCVQRL